MSQARKELIERARVLREEIMQIFADAEHWNSTHTVFERVDPDPDGMLNKTLAAINKSLEKEITQ